MTTTAVFAEILVGGIGALIWVVLIALSIARPSTADAAAFFSHKDWAAPALPLLLAVAYALGIIVDRVADSLFRKAVRKAHKESKTRLRVLARGDKVTDFIEYIRSRLRIARVTTLNLILITLTAPLSLKPAPAFATFVVLAALTLAAAFTMWRIGETYAARLCEAAKLPVPEKKS
jgi:hypothetical protein